MVMFPDASRLMKQDFPLQKSWYFSMCVIMFSLITVSANPPGTDFLTNWSLISLDPQRVHPFAEEFCIHGRAFCSLKESFYEWKPLQVEEFFGSKLLYIVEFSKELIPLLIMVWNGCCMGPCFKPSSQCH